MGNLRKILNVLVYPKIVSLTLDHPSLNEAGTKDYQSCDVPPSKEKQFLQIADGYRIAIWNPRTEMH